MNKWHSRRQALPLIEPDLERVRPVLHEVWTGTSPSIQPLIQAGSLEGGKLLRPSLLLLSGSLFGAVTTDHIHTAAVLELVHSASLLHDDVLDHGNLRRGMATINRRHGNRTAVLLGDLLLAKASELSTCLDLDLRGSCSDGRADVRRGDPSDSECRRLRDHGTRVPAYAGPQDGGAVSRGLLPGGPPVRRLPERVPGRQSLWVQRRHGLPDHG